MTASPSPSSTPSPAKPSDDDDAALAREISAALQATNASLPAAVATLTPLWSSALSTARASARVLQSRVLAQRVARRDAFRHGAALASALHLRAPAGSQTPVSSLASSEAAGAALALRNVSHTLHLVRFLEAAPGLVRDAAVMLDRVAEEAPAASDLFSAHENLCACRRVRDYALLDALPNLDYAGQMADIFTGLSAAEEQLEHYLIANIFSSVQIYAQTDPRVLVAAVRIVQRDREEDDWWGGFLERAAMQTAGELVRPEGRRDYEKRMYGAMTKSIEGLFGTPPTNCMSVEETLTWIDRLLAEELEARRFVVPCFPPEYEIGLLFATEYHRGIMGILTDLFQSAQAAGGSTLSTLDVGDHVDNDDSDVVKMVEWYRSYRWGPSGTSLGASCFNLPSTQRDRLVIAVTRRSRKKMLATVARVLEIDAVSVIWHTEPGVDTRAKGGDPTTSSSQTAPAPGSDIEPGTATTAGPEKVFGAVGNQVKEARVLGIPALDTEMGYVVTSVLAKYRDGMHELTQSIHFDNVTSSDESFICATANNLARCMEYAEELWEAISPFVENDDRIGLEQSFEEIIDGFRESASVAVQLLADLASSDLQRQSARFFAPRSGTEVMLDVTSVLTSFFLRYEMCLIPYHFATFAGVCIRFVTFQYLCPFLALGSARAQPKYSRSIDSHRPGDDGSSYSTPSSSFYGSFPSSSATSNGSTGAGLAGMHANGVDAQMTKDVSNLFGFFRTKASLLEKKQIDVPAAAFDSVRKLFTCHPSIHSLITAHEEAASAVIALGALPDGSTLRLPVESSEAMWNMRKDVKTTNLLEAVARLRRQDLGSVATEKNSVIGAGISSELRWKP